MEEVRLFLVNIGLTEVTSVERIGRYKSYHTSFHVTIPVYQNIDLVYNYEWRDGIIVEPVRMSTRHLNYNRRHHHVPHTVNRKSTYDSHQQRSINFHGSHTEIYQSHPQASLHRSSSSRCCCYRPTPPACSCGGVRQPNFSREALPGVSST